MSDAPIPLYFEHQHARLDAQLHAHLLAVVGGELAAALAYFDDWYAALQAHIAVENDRLLPHVPADARWAARVYLLEHERILLLADEHRARLQLAAEQAPPVDERARRVAVLALLDAVHSLRHVLEHHHAREEQTLALELPEALQRAAWGDPSAC